MVTLSEAITLAKQKENEIFRLTQLRKSVINQPFDEKEYLGQKEEFEAEDYNKQRNKFIEDKKQRLVEIETQIEEAIAETVRIRNAINKKNVETGQDMNLIKMKWIRIQLDNLMKTLGQKRRMWDNEETLNEQKYAELGLGEKLKQFEEAKNKLDAEIQKLNHTTEIVL